MKTQTVKGFQDFVGTSAAKRMKIKKIVQKQFELYGFEFAETPTIEYEEFVRGENQNDEAVSDLFTLEDKGKRKLALKYESTFQLKRIAKNQKLPYKRYQVARVFRNEPVSATRFREFTQFDADIVGCSLKDEAEILSLAKSILNELKIESTIYINNRKLLDEIMVSMDIKERYRLNVIRELDKLDKLPKSKVADNLKEYGAEKILKIFEDKEKLEKFNFYKEVNELIKLANSYGVELEFKPTLARGLSYYDGTIFEIKTKEMKETICGGGAYKIGEIKSIGFAFGLERLSILTPLEGDKIKFQVISINQDEEAILLTQKLRESEISVNLILDKTIPKAMEYANSKEIQNVIFVGKDEFESKRFKVKNMETGEEKILSIDEIIAQH